MMLAARLEIVEWTALVATVVAGLYVQYHLVAAAVERGVLDANLKRDRGTTVPQGIGYNLAWRIVSACIAVASILFFAWRVEIGISDGAEEPRRSYSSSE